MVESKGQGSGKRLIKVLVGIPNEGHTEVQAYDNRLEMFLHLGNLQLLSSVGQTEYCGVKFDIPEGVEYQFSLTNIGQVFPALARERIAEIALEGDFDYVWMIDDDMICPMDTFENLVKHKVDIIAPLAFTRSSPHKPVLYNLTKGWDKSRGENYYINMPVVNYPKNQLVRCDAVGFGSVLIDTKVLKGMQKPYFMTTSGAGEDIHFCHKAGELGFKVYMDTNIKLGHLGYPKVITEECYEQEMNIEELRNVYGDQDKYAENA